MVAGPLPILNGLCASRAYADRILKGEKPADLLVQALAQVYADDQPQGRQGARPQRALRFSSKRTIADIRKSSADDCTARAPLTDVRDEFAPVHRLLTVKGVPASDVESSTDSDWVGRCRHAQKSRR